MTENTIKGASRRTVATLVALLATALTLLALASPARADTVWVNNGYDPGDGTCNSDECTLREPISAAAPGDTVKFAPSVPGTIVLRDGHLEIDKDLKIEGPGADKLVYKSSRLSYKRHSVRIVAKDAAGNVAKRSWRFTVKKR